MNDKTRRASFDIDGVLNMGEYPGVYPGPSDVIITGRSWQEAEETTAFLESKGLLSKQLFVNPVAFEEKTRDGSGKHKANTINRLNKQGYNIVVAYEDDPIQAAIIRAECPDVQVVLLVHDLVEKENVRHL